MSRTEAEIASAIERMNRERSEAEEQQITRLVAEGKVVRASDHQAFVEALTDALTEHGVPATSSWREAIDYLAAKGAS